MTESQPNLEAALEGAIELLRSKPELDAGDEQRLRRLLETIRPHQPALQALPEDPLRRKLDELSRHLDTFQRRWAKDHPDAGPHWLSSQGFLFPG